MQRNDVLVRATAQPPPPFAVSEEMLALLSQHFVAITCVATDQAGFEKTDVFSAFVLEVDQAWWLISAGHILRKMKEYQTHFGKSIRWSLYDSWSKSAHQHTIPFNFGDATKVHLENEIAGTDVGVIALEANTRRLLEKNGIKALDESAWGEPTKDFDWYSIVGVPEETIDPLRDDAKVTHYRFSLANIPFVECIEPKEMKKEMPRIYGRVPNNIIGPDGVELEEIEGMSGGPILGFSIRDGYWSYRLVAIQSSWSKQLRVVAGNYVYPLAKAIRESIALMDDAIDDRLRVAPRALDRKRRG